MAEYSNLDRIMTLYNEQSKHSCVIGVFADRINFSIFDMDRKAAPVIKHLMYHTTAIQFKSVLNKFIKDKEAAPIELGSWPRNIDLKANEFRSAVTVGRDNDKCIYLEFTGDKHKEPIRFHLIEPGSRSVRIDGMELPKQSQTEMVAIALVELFPMMIQAIFDNAEPRSAGGPRDIITQTPGVGTGTDVNF